MNKSIDAQYRRLFQQAALSPEHSAALRDQIINELHQQVEIKQYAGRTGMARKAPQHAWRHAVWATGLAATVILVWCMVRSGPTQPEVAMNGDLSSGIPVAAGQRTMDLFAGLDSLFGRHLLWVSETNGQLDLGITPEARPPHGCTEPVLLRISVLRRDVNREWRHYFQTDVLVRNAQFTEIVADTRPDIRLQVWATPAATGQFAVNTALFMEDGRKLASYLSDLVTEGVPHEMTYLTSAIEDFRVFQTIQMLHDTAG